MRSSTEASYDWNRKERIVINFRNDSGEKRELRFYLPAGLSMTFHWWMMTHGVLKV